MARSLWTGSVSFGLVNVPVRVFSAVRDHDVHFHQVEARTGARIRHKKVSERTGREVAADRIRMAYEVGKGEQVTFDPEELADLRPRTTRTIDVVDFVDLAAIDPIYYERTYWLAPAGEEAARPYRLLLAAMEDRQQVGIGTVVMRNKQYLAAVRPLDGALAMSTMRFADEVVPKGEVEDLPARRSKPPAKELALATQVIDALATDWDPRRYADTYTDQLRDLIERRAGGEDVEVEEAPAPQADVVDLMEALQASLDSAKGTKRRPATRAGGRSRKSA